MVLESLDGVAEMEEENQRIQLSSTVDEAADLLEDFWFFDNLFGRKSSILRSNSEIFQPNFTEEMSVKSSIGESSSSSTLNPPSSLTRQLREEEITERELTVTPVQAPSMEEKGGAQAIESNCKGKREKGRRKLLRTPSLPPYFGREDQNEFVEKETEFRLRNSTQKNQFQFQENSKISRIPRYHLPNSMKSRKTLSSLESEEVQGFKELGFIFEKEEITPKVIEILPGLRQKETEEDLSFEEVRRPYLSEAWSFHGHSPPSPNWISRSSSAEDMKSQIKFWARAVASNVHPPVS